MSRLAGTVFDAISRYFEQSNWDRVTQRDTLHKGEIVRSHLYHTILASCNLQYTQWQKQGDHLTVLGIQIVFDFWYDENYGSPVFSIVSTAVLARARVSRENAAK